MPATKTPERPSHRPKLGDKSRLYRGRPARGLAEGSKVDREGGDYGFGLIPGASIITRGEALGHQTWVDAVMLRQTAEAINAAGDRGVKVRFTHPSLSGDGLGKRLGRAKAARVEGDKVLADIHFQEVGHKGPEGEDPARYVMDLAEDDADSFGVSIAFDPDFDAEREFMLENGGEEVETYFGIEIVGFESPDDDNENNYPHARLAELGAADVVDDPAANPDGLFHRGDGAAFEADALVSYALGISDKEPGAAAGRFGLGVDPSRVRGFVARCLDQHGYELREKTQMSEENNTNDVPAEGLKNETAEQVTKDEPKPEDKGEGEGGESKTEGEGNVPKAKDAFTGEELSRAELGAKFKAQFGEQRGAKYFADGLSFAEALAADNKALHDRVNALAEGRKADEQTGDGVDFSANAGDAPKKRSAFEYSQRKNTTA